MVPRHRVADRRYAPLAIYRTMSAEISATDPLAARFLSPQGRARMQQAIAELREWLGSRLSVADATREQHGHGEASGRTYLPDAVVWPENTGEVSRIVATCAK